MAKTEHLEFASYELDIDPELLRFTEATLSDYITRESAYYDNYGAYLALAEKNLQNKELIHERMFAERLVEAKESGSTDKLAEYKAKCDPTVVAAKEDVVEARYVVNRLKQHLRAWDKNHDNAQSMGYLLRKTIDKMGGDIRCDDQVIERVAREWDKMPAAKKDTGEGFETDLSLDNLY